MHIRFGAKTDLGLKRSRNEDSYYAGPELGLYIVCDGMGGHDAGDVASALAVETIRRHVAEGDGLVESHSGNGEESRFSPEANRLVEAIRLANRAIMQAAQSGRGEGSQAGTCTMGTTVVAVLVHGPVLSFAHVGDSRLYLIRKGTIDLLTADHTLVAEQVRQGLLTQDEANRSPRRNIVTRALGITEEVEIDLDEVPLERGDRLLLCSDGLLRGVSDQAMLEAVTSAEEPQMASDRLVMLAREAGGEDNITAIVVAILGFANGGWWNRFRGWWNGPPTRTDQPGGRCHGEAVAEIP
ncbi:MAG: Stp1/IreP family PP2C-type Ser/Thr phosphatase [Nitrospirales bacterium]